MTEKEIEELYGKSIWDMSTEELFDNGLIVIWAKLVDENNC